MGEVAASDRERLLRSKRDELTGIVASRKRKLRELYAICDNEGPVPQVSISNPDAPYTTTAEKHFLEVSDILQGRLFDESNLPTRRQLRSSTAKNRSPIRKNSPETRSIDSSRKLSKSQRDDTNQRKQSTGIPLKAGVESNLHGKEAGGEGHLSIPRSPSKGSQADQRVNNVPSIDAGLETAPKNSTRQSPSIQNGDVSTQASEVARIKATIESPPGSPGADPRKVLPITAEESAELPRTAEALGSNDVRHKAATIHLPPREVQEARLQERKHARQQPTHLSINPTARDSSHLEPASSPSSTVGAHSATTPVHHEASTDTSPENDNGRYDAERLEHKGEDEVHTPRELQPSPEEVARKEQHDRIQQAQIEVSRREILGEDADAASAQTNDEAPATFDKEDEHTGTDELVKKANEVVEDVEADHVDGGLASEPGDQRPLDVTGISTQGSTSGQKEVADSEAEDLSPIVDAMEVDAVETQQNVGSVTGPPSADNIVTEQPSTVTTQASPEPTTQIQTPGRMVTRVSSGAIRQKPVSEILGQIPPPHTDANGERNDGKDNANIAVDETLNRARSTQSPRVRTHAQKAKDKKRTQLSTVIFPPSSRPQAKPVKDNSALLPSNVAKDDYFTDLFIVNAMAEKRGTASLENLIGSAHKTITTSNAFVPIIEHQTLKVLKRIYNLQSSHKWSLRQPKRSPEAIRSTTHWDVLLQEAKWMQTDFREERKWKMAAAKNLASACAEWVNDEESRPLLQLKTKIPPQRPLPTDSIDMGMTDASEDLSQNPPDHSELPIDDFDEEPQVSLLETVSPASIFALQDDDIIFGLRQSPASQKLLNELPMYGLPLTVPSSDLPTSELDPDRLWKRLALPLSKFVDGRMVLKSAPPPRKRSRFEYEDEDDDEEPVIFGEASEKEPILEPVSTDVALFNPEHKHIRDRIHSSHQFRPPSEFAMPQQSFFECRTSSQWTWTEDDDLKGYVKQYSYNWSLIASLLTSKSLFASGAERRTPWECFERWIHLEGLPADMQKTHYFRTYTNRIESANRIVMMQAAQAPQPPPGSGQIQQPPARKRPTTSVRVDRRRNQKHLTIVDAMRKLAKKRETSVQKQQHAAGMAAMRKANEAPPVRGPAHTPQDFSKLKADREEQMKERIIQLQQRQEAQRRAALLQQRNAGQGLQQGSLPPGAAGPMSQRPGGPLPQSVNGMPNNQNLAVPGQNRARPMSNQMPNAQMQNGLRAPQMTMNGVPAVPPMHGVQGQLPLPNPALNVDLVARAQGVSEQQRRIHEMQQRGQLPAGTPQMHNSPPRMNGVPQAGFQIPNSMMPPFNGNTNGVGTPPANMAGSPGQAHAPSPRMGQVLNNAGASQIKALEQQYRNKFPDATPEQLTRYVNDHVQKVVLQQQYQRNGIAQSAMNAAAGSMNNTAVNMNAQQTPQSYAQMLRQQQESQQKRAQQQGDLSNMTNGNVQAQAQAQAQGPVQGQGQGQANGQTQAQSPVNGQASGTQPGHAHRASSGSVQSGSGK